VPCVTPNENSRLGTSPWVAASVRTASHSWKQRSWRWWLQNVVILPLRSFSAILSAPESDDRSRRLSVLRVLVCAVTQSKVSVLFDFSVCLGSGLVLTCTPDLRSGGSRLRDRTVFLVKLTSGAVSYSYTGIGVWIAPAATPGQFLTKCIVLAMNRFRA
jgi:hypothetical protein